MAKQDGRPMDCALHPGGGKFTRCASSFCAKSYLGRAEIFEKPPGINGACSGSSA